MKKEQVLELINSIDPDLIEEADIQAPARRRLTGRARAGLIAACLCLALVGTGFAARQVYQLTVNITESEDGMGLSLYGDVDKYPLREFGDALLAASEARHDPGLVVQLRFDTFEEVRAFLGENIPAIWPNGGEGWDSYFHLWDDSYFHVDLFHVGLEKLWGVEVGSFIVAPQEAFSIGVTMYIFTEHWQGGPDDLPGAPFGITGSLEQMESYLMPNGATAEIVMQTMPEDPDFSHHPPALVCHGFFVRDGILYNVTAYAGRHTQEEALSLLKGILDSFP